MGEFDWNNAATRRMGCGTAPPSIDIMDALGRHGQTESGLDVIQSPGQNMSLFSRGQHSSVFDTQGSDPTLSNGLTGTLPSNPAIDYAAMEEIIRQRVAHQIGQVTQQARLHSAAFDQQQRTAAMRSLETDEGRMSARLASLTGARDLNASQLSSLARPIPGLPGYPDAMGGIGQPNRRLQLPGLYDNGIGLMDLVGARPGMMQEEEILRGLRHSQHLSNMPLSTLMHQERDANFQGHSQLVNAPPHSRLSCRTCGLWKFSNHLELLEHERTCSPSFNNFDGSTMMPRQRLPNNDALGVDQSLVQALGRDRAAKINCIPPSISTVEAQTLNYPAEIFSTETGVSPHSASPNSKKTGSSPSMVGGENTLFSDIEGGPLVAPEYKYLATAYSYALLSQMQACAFTEADRLGKRKGLTLGFAGLACRHCYGGYGSGRFFPSNIKTMSDTSKTLNVLHSHMMRCRKCPIRVKVGLQTLRLGHDEERSRMKFGSQKAFFVNIWKKLHGESPLDGRKVSHKKRQSMTEAIEEEKKSPEVKSDTTPSLRDEV